MSKVLFLLFLALGVPHFFFLFLELCFFFLLFLALGVPHFFFFFLVFGVEFFSSFPVWGAAFFFLVFGVEFFFFFFSLLWCRIFFFFLVFRVEFFFLLFLLILQRFLSLLPSPELVDRN